MFKRGKNWCIFIRVDGRKIQKSLGTSDKKLAKQIEAKIRADLLEGKYFDKPRKRNHITVRGLVAKYLEEHSKPNKAEGTYKNDVYFFVKVLEEFGELKISQVAPKLIHEFIVKRRKDGVADNTINHELRLFRHCFKFAVKVWDLIDKNPFLNFDIPKGDKKRVRYLSDEEEKRLYAALPEWLVPIVTVAREAGLRLSNIANLTWKQVDLFKRIIVIEQTKNGDPIGLPMTEKLFETLKARNKVRRLDTGYVFAFKKDGSPFRRYYISEQFRAACKEACVENLRFHDLRHDFCSRLVQAGVDLYTVAALAGHKDVTTTQRYAHLSPEKLREAVKVLDKTS